MTTCSYVNFFKCNAAQLNAIKESIAVNSRERQYVWPMETQSRIIKPDYVRAWQHAMSDIVTHFLFLFNDTRKHNGFTQTEQPWTQRNCPPRSFGDSSVDAHFGNFPPETILHRRTIYTEICSASIVRRN